MDRRRLACSHLSPSVVHHRFADQKRAGSHEPVGSDRRLSQKPGSAGVLPAWPGDLWRFWDSFTFDLVKKQARAPAVHIACGPYHLPSARLRSVAAPCRPWIGSVPDGRLFDFLPRSAFRAARGRQASQRRPTSRAAPGSAPSQAPPAPDADTDHRRPPHYEQSAQHNLTDDVGRIRRNPSRSFQQRAPGKRGAREDAQAAAENDHHRGVARVRRVL